MARKNVGVVFGRPRTTQAPKSPEGRPVPAPGVAPSGSFAPGIPAKGFSRGGRAGFTRMPHYHDDPNHSKGKC